MVFGPRRRLPDFDLQLGGVSLPVVSSYKYLGVLLTPTLSWTKDVQLLIRPPLLLSVWLGAALSTSQSKWHHQFSASMFSPMSRGGQNFSHNHQQLCTSWIVQFADGVVTFWAGLPAHLVLVYFANLDVLTPEHQAMGRLLSLWGHSFSIAVVLDAHSPPLCPQCGVSIARAVGPPCTCHVCPS